MKRKTKKWKQRKTLDINNHEHIAEENDFLKTMSKT